MRCLAIVSVMVLGLVLAACKKKEAGPEGTGAAPTAPMPTGSSAPAPTPAPGSAAAAPAGDNYVAVFTQFKDRVCACADKPCKDKVLAELKAYGDAHPRAALDLTPDDARTALAIGEQLNDCIAKAGSGAAP